MEHLIDEFKNSMKVIQAMSLYDFQHQKFLFADKALPEVSFLVAMAEELCFEDCEFLYFEGEQHHFFVRIRKDKEVLAILLIDQNKSYNKIILEHKCAEFLEKVTG